MILVLSLGALGACSHATARAVEDHVLARMDVAYKWFVDGDFDTVLAHILQRDYLVGFEAAHVMVGGLAVVAEQVVAGAAT